MKQVSTVRTVLPEMPEEWVHQEHEVLLVILEALELLERLELKVNLEELLLVEMECLVLRVREEEMEIPAEMEVQEILGALEFQEQREKLESPEHPVLAHQESKADQACQALQDKKENLVEPVTQARLEHLGSLVVRDWLIKMERKE